MASKLICFLAFIAFGISCQVLGSPANKNGGGPLKTCPGFPGYCSESYPGDTCLVVCAFGRNNVPECQADGTWTDIPRCIEHEPGIPEQVPGLCPGIPGYCSIDYPGGVCEFDCITGPDIRSFCTPDGTWDPYPTCDGDVRETQDGCDPCPGPFGGPRNRTAEAASGTAPVRNKGGPKNQPPPQQAPRQAAAPANQNNNRQGQGNNNVRPPPQQQARPAQQQAHAPRNNGNGNGKQNNGGGNGNGNNGRNNYSNGNGNGQQQQQQQQQQQHQQQQHQQAQKLQQGGGGGQKQQSHGNGASKPQANQVIQGSASVAGCPGGSLEGCIDVCPSDSARIFGACVNGCAKRCPSKK